MRLIDRITEKWFRPKDENSPRFRRYMARHLNGRHIKYVTERKDNTDEIIGREGALVLKDEEFIVYASQEILFRTTVEQLRAWELLSLEGVVITAPDLTHDGEERTIIAYYKYYR